MTLSFILCSILTFPFSLFPFPFPISKPNAFSILSVLFPFLFPSSTFPFHNPIQLMIHVVFSFPVSFSLPIPFPFPNLQPHPTHILFGFLLLSFSTFQFPVHNPIPLRL